jgi:AcrR family transcriptional regulator
MVNSPTQALRGPLEHDVRTQIVLAATEHFRHYGYEKTTVSDLAKSIGFSKAYIYKFFASKQAIGEVICSNCLSQIEADVQEALARVEGAAEKLRALVTVIVESSLRLFLEDRRLYEIAAAAATERWGSVDAYGVRTRDLIARLVQEGRDAGEFERKTPLDEAARSIYMVLLPYVNPVTLQYLAGTYREAPTSLAGIILRSLSSRSL